MNLSNLHCLACFSFSKNFVRDYFTISNIIKGFFVGFFLCISLLFYYFEFSSFVFYTFTPIIGLFLLFRSHPPVWFFSGFFVGLFWFYWVGYSFIYYDLAFLAPLGTFLVALSYAVLFLFPALLFKNVYLRVFSFISFMLFLPPFGFNWLDFRILFINTPYDLHFISLYFIAFFALILSQFKGYFKALALIPLLLSLKTFSPFYTKPMAHKLNLDIKLVQTNIAQDEKWDKNLLKKHLKNNLFLINQAIKEKKDLIILPESAFPMYLNRSSKLTELLKEKSKKISIITGALTYKDRKFYNSTYVFSEGKLQIFNKVFLVPFGEEVPLPSFIKRLINDVFYGGAEDFSTAKKPQDYLLYGQKIRNAICFEATKPSLYKDNPNLMIAISNNAWFVPSTEPLLQHLLLQMFANLHNTTIYHSVNGSKSEIIMPK